MTTDLPPGRIRLLTERAAQAGYRLIRDGAQPGVWVLLDTEDSEFVHSESGLDGIERWLDE